MTITSDRKPDTCFKRKTESPGDTSFLMINIHGLQGNKHTKTSYTRLCPECTKEFLEAYTVFIKPWLES